ncbi:MAG: GHKL domain-containing protein [Spartobacteria bacterium]|nr:GHKL domain-containing protein [Spartobacteria bacterium]
MHYTFEDLVDINAVREMVENFHAVFNVAVSIGDLNGNRIISIGDKTLCKDYHQIHSASKLGCKISRSVLSEGASSGKNSVIHSCSNGLNDAAAPIYIRGHHVATFYIGQFFTAPPDEETFRKRAQKFDFNEQEYMAALKDIPIISATKVEHILRCATLLCTSIGEVRLRSKEVQKESEDRLARNKWLEQRVRERTKELELANKELEHQNQILQENHTLRDQMEHITKHDLRTPINGMIGLAELVLLDDNLTKEQREWLSTLVDTGHQTVQHINRTLSLYKVEDGHFELKCTDFNLTRTLYRISIDTANLQNAKNSNLVFTINGEEATSEDPFILSGDQDLCYTIFSNLIVNALEASPHNHDVQVHMKKQNDIAHIVIENNGAIPAEIRDRFFEKMVTAGKVGGTGLGTYAARLAAEQHGGSIQIVTADDDHTVLEVVLPQPANAKNSPSR